MLRTLLWKWCGLRQHGMRIIGLSKCNERLRKFDGVEEDVKVWGLCFLDQHVSFFYALKLCVHPCGSRASAFRLHAFTRILVNLSHSNDLTTLPPKSKLQTQTWLHWARGALKFLYGRHVYDALYHFREYSAFCKDCNFTYASTTFFLHEKGGKKSL